jgi:hypothetical protein
MQLRLSSSVPPRGRCAILAKKIHLVTLADPQWCLQTAQSLFDEQHPLENPAILQVVDATQVGDLETICGEYGIAVLVE